MRVVPVLALLILSTICGCDAGYEYVTCTTDADCRGGATCRTLTWTGGTGRMCTGTCGLSVDCPHSGRCVDLAANGTFLCFDHCAGPTDCGAGFACQPLTNGDAICLPGSATP